MPKWTGYASENTEIIMHKNNQKKLKKIRCVQKNTVFTYTCV